MTPYRKCARGGGFEAVKRLEKQPATITAAGCQVTPAPTSIHQCTSISFAKIGTSVSSMTACWASCLA
jgi:hypothetical protein